MRAWAGAPALALLLALPCPPAHADPEALRTTWSTPPPLLPPAKEPRSYALVREQVAGWDGPRPERSWWLDTVLGFGGSDIANPLFPDAYREEVYTVSFIATGVFELSRGRVTVWFRVPFLLGVFAPTFQDDSRRRTLFAFGNIVVEAGRQARVARDLGWSFGAALSCPTITDQGALTFGGFHSDGALAIRAASASRGFESPDLFQPAFLGVSPWLALRWRAGRVRLEPHAKLFGFVSPQANPDHRFAVEVVVGLRASVRVSPHLELAARAWGVVPALYGGDPWMLAAAAELRVPFEHFGFTVGAIAPLALSSGEPRVYGLALALHFDG